MTQPPDQNQPDPLDDSSLTPSEPTAPHGDPLAGSGSVPPPPPPPPGYEQPQYDQGYQQQPPPGYEQPAYQQPQYDQGYQQAGYPQPGVPGAQPGAPYGIHPGTGLPYSDKSKLVAGLLNIFVAGVGRMYIGQVGLGVAQLLVTIFTCGIGALWPLIDGIIILTSDSKDAQGRILRS